VAGAREPGAGPSQAEQLAALARIHAVLEREGIDYWLFGGWAVDFHAGAITREHADLDIAVWLHQSSRVAELLAAEGWEHAPEEGEDGSTSYARGSLRLEVAFLARADDGEIHTPLRDGRGEWPPDSFGDDVAELHGVRARLVGLRSLKADKGRRHDDPAVAAKDSADSAVLERLTPPSDE
jgi:hypothetical protein